MARGRPPKPLEQIKATARDSKHKADGRSLVPRVELQVDHTIPSVPEGITGRGELEWDRIWSAGWWLARDQDHYWVEMVARAYMEIEEYREYIKGNGLITKGYAGQDAANPMIAEIRKCEANIQKCLQVLGFSPTDRARLMIETQKAKSALQEMIESQRAGR